MSTSEPFGKTLDDLAQRGSTELTAARSQSAWARGLRAGLPLLAVIPGLAAFAQFGRWLKSEPAYGIPLVLVTALAVSAPFVVAWLRARKVKKRGVPRASALGALDDEAKLEGRLLAADEFFARPARSAFENAAIDDAAEKSEAARKAALAVEIDRPAVLRPAGLWAAAGVLALAATAWFATWVRADEAPPVDEQIAFEVGVGPEPEAAEEPSVSKPSPPQPEPLTPETARKKGGTAEPQDADASPQVTQDAKESSGKTGTGRSSGAMSSSAASESKSAPSSAGQKSDPSKEPKKPKAADKKKPKETGAEPEPEERPEDEQSGATAGKGSSKGSNKNPTASDWKSRDQVTDTDDQEVEDDEETDEDEEEQENRGGVQPSLRDRRPPVSRDLQIGFGNRPSPDANGRGGPSEQKKSRGVASLVLGVPIPDRIKGRPGPGPTKITQERIEPEAEEAGQITASRRRTRQGDLESPSSMKLDGSLRALVRDYFLKQRATP